MSNRHPAKYQDLADRLHAKGYRVDVRKGDSSDPESVAALIANVQRDFGGIDVFHYNVASMRNATLADQPRDTFGEDLLVNIGGALVAAQAVAPQMSERRSGTILLTGGGYAVTPNPQYLSLSIGKAGIRALALGTFESLKQQGIHIATVSVEVAINPESGQAEAIAELFWQLHRQPIDQWTVEAKYSGG